jgi:hypothetical protein
MIVDFSKRKFMYIICKALVLTSQKTLKPINILSGQILEFVMLKRVVHTATTELLVD